MMNKFIFYSAILLFFISASVFSQTENTTVIFTDTVDFDVELADEGQNVQIPIGGESEDDQDQERIEIGSGAREIDIESNDQEIKIGPSDREIAIETSDQKKIEKPAEISGARQLLNIENEYEKMPTGQLLIELFLAILGKFAYEQKDVENPETCADMAEFPAREIHQNFLAKLHGICMQEILMQKPIVDQYGCRMDLAERLNGPEFGRNFLSKLFASANLDPKLAPMVTILAQKWTTKFSANFMALFLSFAARLTATIGDDCSMHGIVSTSHVRSFIAAFDCIAGTRIGQEIVFDQRMEPKMPINEPKTKNPIPFSPLDYKNASTMGSGSDSEQEAIPKDFVVISRRQRGGESQSNEIKHNFTLLRAMYRSSLTPYEALDLVQLIATSLEAGVALTNASGDAALGIFTGLVSHLDADKASKVSLGDPSPVAVVQQYKLSSDMMCAMATFARDLLVKLLMPSATTTNWSSTTAYFAQVESGMGQQQQLTSKNDHDDKNLGNPAPGGKALIKLAFLAKTMRDAHQKYCSAMISDPALKTELIKFFMEEHFLHYADAIRIDWNPWRELTRVADAFRASVVKQSQHAANFNADGRASVRADEWTRMLDNAIGGGLGQTVTEWKASVRELDARASRVLDALDKARVMLQSHAEEFDHESIAMLKKVHIAAGRR